MRVWRRSLSFINAGVSKIPSAYTQVESTLEDWVKRVLYHQYNNRPRSGLRATPSSVLGERGESVQKWTNNRRKRKSGPPGEVSRQSTTPSTTGDPTHKVLCHTLSWVLPSVYRVFTVKKCKRYKISNFHWVS